MTVFWDRDYVGAEHAFDTTRKSELVADLIKKNKFSGLNNGIVLNAPRGEFVDEATRLITLLHDDSYVDALQTGEPASLASSNGFKWDPGIWTMATHSTAGILNAVHDATYGCFNREQIGTCHGSLSSGLHHADHRSGTGFCTVNGLGVAAWYAKETWECRRVLILDFDAHCGGGTARFIEANEMDWVDQIDLSTNWFDDYESNESRQLYVAAGEDEYLDKVREILNDVTWADYDLVLYNAGVDPHPQISIKGLATRDRLVFNRVADENTPCVYVLAGGYTWSYGDLETVARTHYNTVLAGERLLEPSRLSPREMYLPDAYDTDPDGAFTDWVDIPFASSQDL
jgi:acetoin utilization deacetylase AcuC-like enzyme